jgi:hypothetical protein
VGRIAIAKVLRSFAITEPFGFRPLTSIYSGSKRYLKILRNAECCGQSRNRGIRFQNFPFAPSSAVEILGAIAAAGVTYVSRVVALVIEVVLVGETIHPLGCVVIVLILSDADVLQFGSRRDPIEASG